MTLTPHPRPTPPDNADSAVSPTQILHSSAPTEWWRSAVIYQIYPRSFADSSGDGVGDLPGITSRLSAVADLGADAVWLSPFYTSPQNDAGYDVADYCDVDPLFGTLDDFRRMLTEAHTLGLRVIIDLVPNHSSDQHPWFQDALSSAPGSAERARYIFRNGRGPDGALPPNNWESVFGGPAWTRTIHPDGTPGQWYLHLFDSSQPDFDWNSPWVHERFEEILRFWLDLGVDGFRVDVAHGLIKAPGLPDWVPPSAGGSMGGGTATLEPGISVDDAEHPATAPYWAQDGVHDIYRRWRTITDEYPGERVLCAEAWVDPPERTALWVRPDEMHQAFNFAYLETQWDAAALRGVIDRSFEAYGSVGAPSTWVLSNHDVVRHATRLAVTSENLQGHGLGPKSPGLPDPVVGLRRARAATLAMLALPGSAYLYQGEELGLPEVIDLPDAARKDPTWFRTGGERYGRDGCRVPIPWVSDEPSYGFSPNGESWLPQPALWNDLARSRQDGAQGSTLTLYRTALRLRAEHGLGTGALTWGPLCSTTVLDFTVGDVRVIANTGASAVPVPAGEVILSSADDAPGSADDAPGTADDAPGTADDAPGSADDAPVAGIAADTTVWLRAE